MAGERYALPRKQNRHLLPKPAGFGASPLDLPVPTGCRSNEQSYRTTRTLGGVVAQDCLWLPKSERLPLLGTYPHRRWNSAVATATGAGSPGKLLASPP